LIREIGPLRRMANDIIFGSLTRALHEIMNKLLADSEYASTKSIHLPGAKERNELTDKAAALTICGGAHVGPVRVCRTISHSRSRNPSAQLPHGEYRLFQRGRVVEVLSHCVAGTAFRSSRAAPPTLGVQSA
jgi:hypothetical protein